jgi:hypothetical protein
MSPQTSEIMDTTPRISEDSVKKLYMIREQGLQDRKRYDTVCQEIAAKVNPAMADWSDNPPEKSKVPATEMKEIYDNTAMKGSSRLAEQIQAHAFSRIHPWLRIATEDDELMQRSEVQEWAQEVDVHSLRQYGKSSFYDEIRSFIRCLADFATACMFRVNDVNRGIPYYQNLHLKRVLLMENQYGECDTLFRDLWLTAFDAAAMFGEEILPLQIKQALDQGKTKRWLFQHFIFPLEKFDLDIGKRQTKGMPIYSLYVSDLKKKPIREGGYWVRPFFAARWSRNPDGGVWGADSPGFLEISNVKQANGMRKDYSRLTQLAGRPPIKATEGLRGKIKIEPHGITYVRAGEDYAPGLVVGNVQSIKEDLELIQGSINDSYYSNLGLILTQNIERIKTATEAAGIQAEQAAMLTAWFGRLTTEFAEPNVEDMVQLELEAGRIPPPPPVLQGQRIKVDLISPLAQLQKRYLLLDNTRQALNEIYMTAKMQVDAGEKPDVLDNFDLDQHVRDIAEMYYMDKRIVRDLIDVARIREVRARREAAILNAQMQTEAAKAGAQVYGATSKAPEAGSPAEAMVGSPASPR